jgi:glycosyltransferase involved in cell wall biosynthesis
MVMDLSDITALIINWKTLDLVQGCAESLLHFYPDIQVVMVDNDSQDASTEWIRALAEDRENVSAIMNCGHSLADAPVEEFPALVRRENKPLLSAIGLAPGGRPLTFMERVLRALWGDGNVGHGPALHQGFMLAKTRYTLALDSDCVVRAAGFIEEMLDVAVAESAYAVGRDIFLATRGGHAKGGGGYHHVHTSVSVLDMEKYKTLLPYVLFGVSGILNMPDAQRKGYPIVDYPIGAEDSAVHHSFRGSRKRYGGIPKLRSLPYLPEVLLQGLETEYIGGYFK